MEIPSDDVLLRRIEIFLEHLERAYDDTAAEGRRTAQKNKYALKVLHQRIWEKFTTSLSDWLREDAMIWSTSRFFVTHAI